MQSPTKCSVFDLLFIRNAFTVLLFFIITYHCIHDMRFCTMAAEADVIHIILNLWRSCHTSNHGDQRFSTGTQMSMHSVRTYDGKSLTTWVTDWKYNISLLQSLVPYKSRCAENKYITVDEVIDVDAANRKALICSEDVSCVASEVNSFSCVPLVLHWTSLTLYGVFNIPKKPSNCWRSIIS